MPVNKMMKSATIFARMATGDDLRISPKTVVLASKKGIGKDIVKRFRDIGIPTKYVLSAKDLGVGRVLGERRCTAILSKRISQTKGRVYRIKVLRRTNAGAAKLVNTGAMPQATYGKEACGLSMEMVHRLRSMAACAVGSSARGQCNTTRIWLTLGMHNDPWVKAVVDQVKTWLWLYAESVRSGQTSRTAQNWELAKAKILGTEERIGAIAGFRKVIGPMGGTIAMLHYIGWTPVGPDKWADANNETWQYSGGNQTPLLNRIREDMTQLIWIIASNGYNGKGLENTPDLRPIGKQITYLERNDQHSTANLLQTIVAGGIWSGARKVAAGIEGATDVCPHCGQTQTDLHLWWTCPAYEDTDLEPIKKTQNKVVRAIRHHDDWPCYWLRGIGLSIYTNHPQPAIETSYNIGGVEPAEFFDPDRAVYLDGSGGPDGRDPRTRRVGWAWCQYFEIPSNEVRPHVDTDDIGQYGTMEGYQSVPRSELFALMAIALYTARLPTPAALLIISDNKAVVDGFAKGPRPPDGPSHSNMGDLWERFWAIHELAKGAGWTFTVQKIKSHTLEQDFNEYPLDLDVMPMEHRIGNSRADRWADYAASLVSLSLIHI